MRRLLLLCAALAFAGPARAADRVDEAGRRYTADTDAADYATSSSPAG
jgi:hypothetical protein